MLIESLSQDNKWQLGVFITAITLMTFSVMLDIPLLLIIAVGGVIGSFIGIPVILYLITPNDKIVRTSGEKQ